MRLPNSDRAVAEISKLRDYCLNLDQPEGRHRVRVFRASLGMTSADAEELRAAVLSAAREEVAVPTGEDGYGQRYTVDFAVCRSKRTAVVRSGWIVKKGEDFPRLTTCYVL
jgi:hypothetical protein